MGASKANPHPYPRCTHFFFFLDPCLLSYGAEPYGGHYLQYRTWLFVCCSSSCMSVLINGPCVLRCWVMFVHFECVSSFLFTPSLLLPYSFSFGGVTSLKVCSILLIRAMYLSVALIPLISFSKYLTWSWHGPIYRLSVLRCLVDLGQTNRK